MITAKVFFPGYLQVLILCDILVIVVAPTPHLFQLLHSMLFLVVLTVHSFVRVEDGWFVLQLSVSAVPGLPT